MNSLLTYKKTIASLLGAFVFLLALPAGLAQAGMVSTESQLEIASQSYDKAVIQQKLKEQEVKDALISWGVEPNQVEQRVANMTAEEIGEFNRQMDSMAAGSGIVGAVLFVFLILIVLDLLGTTNIFPVIKPIDQY